MRNVYKCVSLLSILLVIFLIPSQLSAQTSFKLQIEVASSASLKNKLKSEYILPDSALVIKKADEVLTTIRGMGYLMARLVSLTWEGKKAKAYYDVNKLYKAVRFRKGNVPEGILSKAGISVFKPSKHDAFTLEKYNKVYQDILTAYENSGYPFASLQLDSVEIKDHLISGSLNITPGNYYVFDTLIVAGDVKVSRKYLESYLDIEEGSGFNNAIVEDVEKRLAELPFVRSVKKLQVKYTSNKASVIVFLEKQSSNQFDGILGLLPDAKSQKLQFTGDIRMHVQNAFKRAEIIDFNFRGLPQKTKELNVGLNLSELSSTPLGLDFRFNLYKQDTNYQNVNSKATLNYRIKTGRFSLFIHNITGLPISADSADQNSAIYSNTNFSGYGVGFLYRTLNSLILPRKGISFEITAETGKRRVSGVKNLIDAGSEITSKTTQYRLFSQFDAYHPVSIRGIAQVSSQVGILAGKQFFVNELYRIGGFNSLRGFNEQSILATNYAILNLEYRFLIESSSYLFAFINQGFVETKTVNLNTRDKPMGFGAGLNLQIKTGVFSISYALGKQKDNPLNLQGGKIHFGLITLF